MFVRQKSHENEKQYFKMGLGPKGNIAPDHG